MRLPKIETLVILIFLGSVLLWAVSRCNSKKAHLAAREKNDRDDDRQPRRDTVFVPQTPAATPAQQPVVQQAPQVYTAPGRAPAATPANDPNLAATAPGRAPGQTATAAPAATQKYSTLYVTIDGLKMRKEPGLKGAVVTKLELYQPVFFLNQKTEWTQEISLGAKSVTDHWVKIRTQSGKEGWVFGAGVHYYKMKQTGTLE